MIELTQTKLDPGNCWQTGIACLLEVPIESLPTQEHYDWYVEREDGNRTYGPDYSTALGSYLRKHHGLAYIEIDPSLWPVIQLKEPGLHTISGTTIRSATNGGRRHLVIGRHGEMVWDPHPSRAGLIGDFRWWILAPFPKHWEETWDRHSNRPCECPQCGRPPDVPAEAKRR